MKIKKDKWTKIAKTRSIEIKFNDFKKGSFKFRFGDTESEVKGKTIKIIDKKEHTFFVYSNIDTTIEVKKFKKKFLRLGR